MQLGEADADASVSIGELMIAWAQVETVPKIILDHDLNLIWSNRAADEHIETGDFLTLTGGSISCPSAEQTSALRAFVRDCSANLCTLCLRDPAGGGHMLFRAWRIRKSERTDIVGTVFYHSSGDVYRNCADLGAAFGLTPTQIRVVSLLLDGQPAEQIAGTLHISTETVRTHIRSVYAKLNVTSREALFAKLRPYRTL